MTHRTFAAGAVALAAALAAAPAAHAANRQTLDPAPATPAHVLIDPPGSAPGTAVVAWVSESGGPKYCLIAPGGTCAAPQALPGGSGIDGLFPLVRDGALTFVGPRSAGQDAIVWSPGAAGPLTPHTLGGADGATIQPQDAIAAGSDTLIGGVDAGLGIAGFGPAGTGAFAFTNPGDDVKSSSLALDRNARPVDVYFDLGGDPTSADGAIDVTRYKGSGTHFAERNWTHPVNVATGDAPVLSGGASGLFLISQDTAPGQGAPTLLDVRKDDGTSFGAPVTLADDPAADLFDGGAAAQAPGGRLAILWPVARGGDGLKVMRLFTSSDAGATFQQSDVAAIGEDYGVDRNAAAAVADDGTGVVAYTDAGGLELADFAPIAPFAPPANPVPPGIPTPAPIVHGPVFDPVYGPFTSRSTQVGHDVLTLRTPRGCVTSGVVVARLSVHSVRSNGHVLIKVRKVRFRYDGRLVHTRSDRPMSVRFRVTVAPGTRHTLTARVFIKTHRGSRITRKLRSSFTACSG